MKVSILIFFCLIISLKTFAQADSLKIKDDLKIFTSYTSTLKDNLRIFNGREYSSYLYPLQGSPFYLDSTHLRGSIIYNDVLYQDISLTFDIIKDQLIVNSYTSFNQVIIPENSVKEFNLGSHYFINLSFMKDLGKEGYFEILGNYFDANLLAKRSKRIKENLEGIYKILEVESVHSYYYLKNNKIIEISDWKSIFSLFPDKKKGIKEFRKQKKLIFKNQTEDVIKQVIDFAETG